MRRFIGDLKRYYRYIFYSAKSILKQEVADSFLNWVWLILNPIMFMLVYSFVQIAIFGNETKYLASFLFIGLTCWNFFNPCITGSIRMIKRYQGIISKVYVPKYLYTLSSILYNFIIFLISLIVLVLVAAVLGLRPTIYLLQAPVALLLLLILSIGCGMILATLGVFFRDLEYLWSVALMLIMYTCAIFYPVERLIKSGWAWILKYNPLFCIIDIFRAAVFGQPMNMGYLLYATGFGVVTVIVGLIMFVKKQDEFILHL